MSKTAIPRTVWVLGFVSLLMDVSSETIQTLLPVFMVAALGASATLIGAVEGFAVVVATAVKFLAGYVSDRTARPKWLAVVGYGLAAVSKLIFPLATGVGGVVAAKGLDRVGKGIRSAPRDALMAAVTPAEIRGRAFGLRKSLDTVGGFVGPLLAIGLMALFAGDVRQVFWVAAIPAFAAVVLLAIGTADPPASDASAKRPPDLKGAVGLNAATWAVIGIAALVGAARFSEAFLVLKGLEAGISATFSPLAIVVLHLVFGLAAFPVGVLSDRVGRRGMLVLSLVMLAGADLILGLSDGIALYLVGVAVWGLHMGFSAGLLTTLIADVAPPHLRGSAFGVFALISGLVAAAGNLVAGLLWDGVGPQATFLAGAALSLACAAALAVWALRPPATCP
ncbi:MFS transporter [Phenylobacterium sp.]|jgi:MFS family permease|uniref:MFS transporter n=1 Tax=Phenylobacterium sp. TaxID=1871053 RepID=UPI003784B934